MTGPGWLAGCVASERKRGPGGLFREAGRLVGKAGAVAGAGLYVHTWEDGRADLGGCFKGLPGGSVYLRVGKALKSVVAGSSVRAVRGVARVRSSLCCMLLPRLPVLM